MSRSPAPRPARRRAIALNPAQKSQLAAAQARCAAQGSQLTPLRTEVLSLLIRRGGAAKAYDLLTDMQARQPGVAPMTVYRALDFLVEQGLAHKVAANSTFVLCQHEGPHAPHARIVMLVCAQCGGTTECSDPRVAQALDEALHDTGFAAQSVEVKGLCAACRAKSDAQPPA
ncbi:Fur family transcriptional regulator [Ottowia cancrivicina]|jgi:ferric uptake regulator, fur family|uniref:Fur family transcriptional regulator n=1 Tax=Ottowia cancrivicina TaxID=3040346 RepID=A0AAW6RN42_9BURK|nr:Fur family transcriptional regulator [Ottowia sp. 10c7w1]MDG9700312.1 Fur family transcriptional regulator [Ottowia sp. 10c7w1]